jgi:hypothetical protein
VFSLLLRSNGCGPCCLRLDETIPLTIQCKRGRNERSNLAACATSRFFGVCSATAWASSVPESAFVRVGFLVGCCIPSRIEAARQQTARTWSCSKACRRARDRSMSLHVWLDCRPSSPSPRHDVVPAPAKQRICFGRTEPGGRNRPQEWVST